jgi:hypothetical protein
MSHPLPDASYSVRPDDVEGLAAELAALAVELADDAGRVRSAASWFPAALDGPEGSAAYAGATAWARLQEVLAARVGVLGGTLSAVAAAYRAEDAALAGHPHRSSAPR